MAKMSVSGSLLNYYNDASNRNDADWSDVWGTDKPIINSRPNTVESSGKQVIDSQQCWLLGRTY